MGRDGREQLIGVQRPDLECRVSQVEKAARVWVNDKYLSTLSTSIDFGVGYHEREYGSLVLDPVREPWRRTTPCEPRKCAVAVAGGGPRGYLWIVNIVISVSFPHASNSQALVCHTERGKWQGE